MEPVSLIIEAEILSVQFSGDTHKIHFTTSFSVFPFQPSIHFEVRSINKQTLEIVGNDGKDKMENRAQMFVALEGVKQLAIGNLWRKSV